MEIEARYIDVDWDSDRNVLGVRYGESIEIIETTDRKYEIETVTFKKLYFYFALRIISENLKHTPFFFFNEKTEELLKVKDPLNGKIWWIAKGKWIKPKNTNKWKYSHEVWRTAGRIELKIQDKLISIENRTNNFNLEELEYVLKDFKGELWNIILKTDSVITGNINRSVDQKVPNIFSSEVVNLIERFINSTKDVLKEPKYKLKETQGLQPIKKVRPVMRTFRELSTRPGSKQLTSRIHITSLNTAENKYAHYCVDKLYTLFNKLQEAAKVSSDKLQEKVYDYRNEASELREKLSKPKVINKSVFEKELQEIKLRLELIEIKFLNITSYVESNSFAKDLEVFKAVNKHFFASDELDRNIETRVFSIDRPMINYQNTFFCNTLDGRDFKKDPYYKDYGGKYLSIEYPRFIAEFLKNYTNKNISISVTGIYDWVDLGPGFKFICLKVFDIKEYIESHVVTLGSNVRYSENDFFCNIINGRNYKESPSSNNGLSVEYFRARFPKNVFDCLESFNAANLTIRVIGTAVFDFEKNYEVISWSSIRSIELVSHPLQNHIKEYESLKNKYDENGWVDKYNYKEKNEIISESKYLSSRAEELSERLQSFIPVTDSLRIQLKKLRKLKLEFKSLGVEISNIFPNSMTYVQNPSYSGLYSSFKSILLESNLSLSQLEKILIIERVGLVNVATLYERWVLLLIIKILSNDLVLFLKRAGKIS